MTIPLLFLALPAAMSLGVYLLRRWVWVQGVDRKSTRLNSSH